jgi:hypothetical protein
MIEKFSDFEGMGYLDKAGEFVFEVTEAELKDSKAGTPMVVLTAKSDAGQTTLYHSLNPKARWSYNKLIKACLNLDTREKIESFECDYELIHNQLVGKKFIGVVECQQYDKEVKKPLDDGTFETVTETKDSYKVVDYKFV